MASRLTHDVIARRVRAEMAAQRQTQRALAEALDITVPKVSRRVSGEVEFSATQLVAVADFLDIGLDELLGRTPTASAA